MIYELQQELRDALEVMPSEYPRRRILALLNEAIRTTILADGSISAAEVGWLRAYILADGKVDEDEKKLLRELKLLADQTCPEFLALFNECMAK